LGHRYLPLHAGESVERWRPFSPDGKYTLPSGNDVTIRLWDKATSQEIRRFTGPASTVEFSPDGTHILTASEDGTARLSLTSRDGSIHAVCVVLTRDLTSEERIEFDITDPGPTCPVQ
jgi:WD40 repeat protein